MNLQAAQNLLLKDRRDWNKPHLPWLPQTLYRLYRSTPKPGRE